MGHKKTINCCVGGKQGPVGSCPKKGGKRTCTECWSTRTTSGPPRARRTPTRHTSCTLAKPCRKFCRAGRTGWTHCGQQRQCGCGRECQFSLDGRYTLQRKHCSAPAGTRRWPSSPSQTAPCPNCEARP